MNNHTTRRGAPNRVKSLICNVRRIVRRIAPNRVKSLILQRAEPRRTARAEPPYNPLAPVLAREGARPGGI